MKKIISVMLTLTLVLASFASFSAKSEAANTEDEKKNQIGTVQGVVTEVRDFFDQDNKVVEGKKFITVKQADESIVTFAVDAETYNITDTALNNIKADDKLTGFYDATLPVIMIYPPQYHAVAIAVNLPEPKSVKVDLFDENLTSSDNQLKLNVSSDTKIVNAKNEAFTGEIKNQRLAVIYTVTTRSIPAQTNPEKIVVLNTAAEPEITDPVEENVSKFGTISGTVTKVSKYYDNKNKVVKNKKYIYIKDNEGSETSFLVTADTYFVKGKLNSIKKGNSFTGYYDATKPVVDIYPPRYTAVAAAVNKKKADLVKVDLFDKNLVSSDGMLKISTGKKTTIVKQNGKKYTGKLTNKNLVVIYNKATKSIPAQTTPTKVVVLNAIK